MTSTFSWHFFGIKIRHQTGSQFWHRLITSHFAEYTSQATHSLVKQTLLITFRQGVIPSISQANRWSPQLLSTPTATYYLHHYLRTTTLIAYHWQDNHLTKIDIFFSSNILFELISRFTNHTLKRQLMQNILKFYIEQPLFWYVNSKTKSTTFHGSTIAKSNQAILFLGLNGVGKSTLAQYCIRHKGYQLVADNYMLVANNHVYPTPDPVRLTSQSLSFLGLQGNGFFGFGKQRVSTKRVSSSQPIPINTVFLLSQADVWQQTRASASNILSRVEWLQTAEQEDVRYSKARLHTMIHDQPSFLALETFFGNNVRWFFLQVGPLLSLPSFLKHLKEV